MGIQGLLPVLRSVTTKIHIGKYARKRLAVDAYCWLHKGAYCCSKELCEDGPADKCERSVFALDHLAIYSDQGS